MCQCRFIASNVQLLCEMMEGEVVCVYSGRGYIGTSVLSTLSLKLLFFFFGGGEKCSLKGKVYFEKEGNKSLANVTGVRGRGTNKQHWK